MAQLVVAFMKDAPAGVAEMRRVVPDGGTVAVCMWDRHGMDLLAAVQRTQHTLALDGPTTEARTMYRSREELELLFADGSFVEVQTELLEVESEYEDYDELWSTLTSGAGPAGAWIKSLDPDGFAAARDELRRQVGEPDGAFSLRARAWATCATRV